MSGLSALDTTHDLALLEVSGLKGVPLKLYAGTVEAGEEVFAVGNPKGLEGTISSGIVSHIDIRRLGSESLIQITTPISPGSSGGPVVNKKHEVVGVAVASIQGGQTLNFAVPATYVSALLASASQPTPLSEIARRMAPEIPSPTPPPSRECIASSRDIVLGVSADAYSYAGTEALKAQDYQRARDAFAYVVRQKPTDYIAFGKLGLAYYHLGCLAESTTAFQRSIVLKPKESTRLLTSLRF